VANKPEPEVGRCTHSRLFDMGSRPRRATAAGTSYDEDTLGYNPTRKRKAAEELEPENTAVESKKRAPQTAKTGSLEWILTSDKSPLTSLPLEVSVGGMTSSVWSALRPSYRE
jgi:hypothetical protein